jgi:hypothetical protein
MVSWACMNWSILSSDISAWSCAVFWPESLSGRPVLLWADNDDAGRQYAEVPAGGDADVAERHIPAELERDGFVAEAAPFAAVISPDAFLEPGRIPQRIAGYCRKTGQPAPTDAASMCRTLSCTVWLPRRAA